MAGGGSVLEDASVLSKLDRGLAKAEGLFALLAGLTVFVMMLLAVFSVTGRNFFNAPLPGYVDWIEYAMPFLAFLGIAWTQRQGGHIRMDILIGQLKGRAGWAAEFVTSFFTFVLLALLIWGAWAHFQRSFDWASPLWSRDSSIDIALPLWPVKLLVPVAFGLTALRVLLQLWGYGRAFVSGTERPIAVPLVLSVAEQAAEEARHVGALNK
ncbi:MAG TPA: C4-dicarboxylate ABC transporter permease [Rhodobacteraceae bacterium]|jgi:TRAP-type C4-dicarboxylate transport system permease small subunit|nr:C4-dicarboxylate ABC transporter permease [Paracoccaceae bacterium]